MVNQPKRDGDNPNEGQDAPDRSPDGQPQE